jgi:hypothetical protein
MGYWRWAIGYRRGWDITGETRIVFEEKEEKRALEI